MRISSRSALGALFGAALSTGLGLLLAVTSAAAPTLAVVGSDATVGQNVHATVQLSESPNASGEISFEIFAPDDPTCAGPPLSPAPASVAVSGEGEYSSGSFSPSAAGTYRWSAHYSGDSENPAADSTCAATSVVAKETPGLTGNASDGVVGAAIHDEATLSGGFSPSGEVVFRVYGPADPGCLTPLSTSAATIQSGEATSPNFLPQQAGAFRWTAEYTGDGNNEAVALPCGAANQSSTVDKASPNLTGTATSATVGSSITDSVTLSNGFGAGGQLLFRAYGPGNPTCSGAAAYEASVAIGGNGTYAPAGFSPGAGSYRWRVEYSGDGNNDPDSLACGSANQSSTVGKAAPSLTGVASSATVGSPITDSITLSAGVNASGQLDFRAYGPGDASCANAPAYEATVAVNGNGPYAPAGFSPGLGVYRWTVEYSGDGNNEAASLPCGAANQTSTVSKAVPILSGFAGSAGVGGTISDTVTLAGGANASGQLSFRAYGPGDPTCAAAPKYEATVAVGGNGNYAPAGFSPVAGAYQWTVAYTGDANNEATGLPCGAANQTSLVTKATPTLAGTASSAPAGSAIADTVTLAGGFGPTGQLIFRAYGPSDPTCGTAPRYEAAVPVNGNGSYAAPGFAPAAGLYRWTAVYSGDQNNEAVGLPCDSANQSSAVGTLTPIMAASASGATIGDPVAATATVREGIAPSGQMTFTAFSPGDTTCSGPPAFSSTVLVLGNGAYRSGPFSPARVGTYRWTVNYTGDPNHAATTVDCGGASSEIARAKPTIASGVEGLLEVGTAFQVTAALQGGHSPGGTVSFRIYGPNATDCAKPLSTNTVTVAGNGAVRSAPFVAQLPGRYSFVASYSGDAANQPVAEACDLAGDAVQVSKRKPRVKPSARLKGHQISIRAKLSGAASPSGSINFRLYRPGDKRCKGKPAFSGGVTVKANGSYLLAEYLATKSGVYRLSVGYSGDQRNLRLKGNCRVAQSIPIG
jgi:hypothetical protein